MALSGLEILSIDLTHRDLPTSPLSSRIEGTNLCVFKHTVIKTNYLNALHLKNTI